MPRIKLHLSIGFATANREDYKDVDDTLWESMSESEREDFLEELYSDWASNYIEGDVWVEEK